MQNFGENRNKLNYFEGGFTLKSILISIMSLFLISTSLFSFAQENKEEEEEKEKTFIALNSLYYQTKLNNKEHITLIEKEVEEESIKKEVKQEVKEKTQTNNNKQQEEKIVQTNKENDGETMYVTATAYTANCDGCTGITYTGINLKDNPNQKVIAVDPNVIPLGSKVWVEGYGTAIAADTGGAIKGNRIDVFVANEADAKRFGIQQLRIKILD